MRGRRGGYFRSSSTICVVLPLKRCTSSRLRTRSVKPQSSSWRITVSSCSAKRGDAARGDAGEVAPGKPLVIPPVAGASGLAVEAGETGEDGVLEAVEVAVVEGVDAAVVVAAAIEVLVAGPISEQRPQAGVCCSCCGAMNAFIAMFMGVVPISIEQQEGAPPQPVFSSC